MVDRSVVTSAFRRGAVGAPVAHDSAHLHVSGEAPYTDDIPEPRDLLHVAVGMSDHAHAKIVEIDTATLLAASGVIAVMTAADIPGDNNCGPVVADDPVFADGVVEYAGQSVFAVAATTLEAARRAARLPVVTYEDLEPVLDIRQAVQDKSFVLPSESIRRGNPDEGIDKAEHRLKRSLTLGGQDQFYLEGQISMAVPAEDGDLRVHSSTQHPGEVQRLVAAALGLESKDIVVECRRMG
jgi:xanthine dehydrogenase large subunit